MVVMSIISGFDCGGDGHQNVMNYSLKFTLKNIYIHYRSHSMARWLDVVVGLIHTCITVVYTLAVSHADKYPCANIEHKRAHSTHKSNHNLMMIKPQQQQINSSNSPKFYMHAHS